MFGIFAGFYLGVVREAKGERNRSRMVLQEALANVFEFEESKLAHLHYDDKIKSTVRGYIRRGKGRGDPDESVRALCNRLEAFTEDDKDRVIINAEIDRLRGDRWKIWKI